MAAPPKPRLNTFTAQDPFPTEGTFSDRREHVFLMWLTAVAPLVKKPYDEVTWVTARPWLTFRQLDTCFKAYKKKSLGSIQLKTEMLTDDDVRKALKYEGMYTDDVERDILDITDEDVQEICDLYFAPAHGRSAGVCRNVVFDKIKSHLLTHENIYISGGAYKFHKLVKKYSAPGSKIMRLEWRTPTIDVLRQIIQIYFCPVSPSLALKRTTVMRTINHSLSSRGIPRITESSRSWNILLKELPPFLCFKVSRTQISHILNRYFVPCPMTKTSKECVHFFVSQHLRARRRAHPPWMCIDDALESLNWDVNFLRLKRQLSLTDFILKYYAVDKRSETGKEQVIKRLVPELLALGVDIDDTNPHWAWAFKCLNIDTSFGTLHLIDRDKMNYFNTLESMIEQYLKPGRETSPGINIQFLNFVRDLKRLKTYPETHTFWEPLREKNFQLKIDVYGIIMTYFKIAEDKMLPTLVRSVVNDYLNHFGYNRQIYSADYEWLFAKAKVESRCYGFRLRPNPKLVQITKPRVKVVARITHYEGTAADDPEKRKKKTFRKPPKKKRKIYGTLI